MLNVVHEYSNYYTVYYLIAAGSTNTYILCIDLPIVIIILIIIGIINFGIFGIFGKFKLWMTIVECGRNIWV